MLAPSVVRNMEQTVSDSARADFKWDFARIYFYANAGKIHKELFILSAQSNGKQTTARQYNERAHFGIIQLTYSAYDIESVTCLKMPRDADADRK